MWGEMLLAFFAALCVVGIYWAVRGFPPGITTYQSSAPPISTNGLDPGQAKFMFFYTPWCPHCKTAQPVWASLKETLKNMNVTLVLFSKISFRYLCKNNNNINSARDTNMVYPNTIQ